MSRRDTLAIQFFQEDRLRVLVLSPLECGAYFRLAFQSIEEPEPCTLPNVCQDLARRAGLAADDWERVQPALTLHGFMVPDDQRVRFPHVRKRYDETVHYRRTQSANGKKGGKPPGNESEPKANSKPTQSQHEPNTQLLVPVLVPISGERENGRAGGREPSVDPSTTASWDRNAAVEAIVTAYPPSRGGKHPAAVRQAIYALGGPMGKFAEQGQQHAAEWLLAKVRAYASSPYVKSIGEYVPGMREWMNGAMYDVPESEWSKPAPGKDEKKQAPAPTYRTGALARMKAEEEARRRTA